METNEKMKKVKKTNQTNKIDMLKNMQKPKKKILYYSKCIIINHRNTYSIEIILHYKNIYT